MKTRPAIYKNNEKIILFPTVFTVLKELGCWLLFVKD